MNWRNKYAVHTIRTLLGLLMIVMGALGLYYAVTGTIPEVPGSTEAIKTAEAGLAAAGYIYVVKVLELVIGLMLLVNFRPALATLLLAPITVAIMVYDIALWMHMPAALIPAWFLLFANIYLGYVYWDKYAPLFQK